MALTAGDRVGSYEVLAPIGAGGMGVVYRARDVRLKREVAIKVLPDGFSADPQRMARFEREARVLASLNHPNIAQVYGVENGALIMELVTGESPRGPMPFDEAWKIAEQIARALEYAHEKGIAHRDLKPANIKITPEGTVKLLDFGLAKAFSAKVVSSGDLEDSPTLTAEATEAGMILGTGPYLAPEQALGKPVDQRVDIWAFGVVFYELLAGKRPFGGGDLQETVAAVLHQPVNLDPIPPQARPLIEHCLEKDRGKRLRHMGDARLLLAGAPSAVPARPSKALLAGALAAVGLLMAALALFFVQFRRPPATLQAARLSVLLPEKSRVLSLAVSPDGREIALVLVKDGKQQIWVRTLEALEPSALAGTDGAADPFWSLDSRYIGFFADAKLKKIEHSGGPVQTLCDALAVLGGTWNRNGDILLGGLVQAQRVSSTGGAVSDLKQSANGAHLYPVFLPDGQHYLATRGGATGSAETGVWLNSMDGPETRRILSDYSTVAIVQPPAGSQVGEVLFGRAGALLSLPFDMKRLEAAGDPFPLAQQVATRSGAYLVAAANHGVLAYVAGQRGGWQYVWRDRQGKNLGIAAGDAGGVVAISPDGKRFTGDRNGSIWVTEFARGLATRLTIGGSSNAIWSSDGRYVAYWSSSGICRKLANGAGAEETLLRATGLTVPKSWSPDGRFVLYAQINPQTGADVLAVPVEPEGKPFVVVQTPGTDDQGQFSPDGHWVAYTSNESGTSEIYVIPFPPSSSGGKWMVSLGGGVQPRWGRNGKELFYISPDSKMMAVDVSTRPVFQAGAPKALFQTDIVDTGIRTGPMSWDIAPDGRFLIITDTSIDASLTVALNWLAGVKK